MGVNAREGFVVATTTVLSLKGKETTSTAVNDRCSYIKSKTIRTNEAWTKCSWTTIFRMFFFREFRTSLTEHFRTLKMSDP